MANIESRLSCTDCNLLFRLHALTFDEARAGGNAPRARLNRARRRIAGLQHCTAVQQEHVVI